MEFSVLGKQCLDRRISSAEELAKEVAAGEQKRNAARAQINWTFRVAEARKKLHWTYPS